MTPRWVPWALGLGLVGLVGAVLWLRREEGSGGLTGTLPGKDGRLYETVPLQGLKSTRALRGGYNMEVQ